MNDPGLRGRADRRALQCDSGISRLRQQASETDRKLKQSPSDPGLSALEAARRLADDGPNAVPLPSPPRLPLQILHAVRQPLSLVLVAAGLATALVLDELVEGLAIGGVVVLNVAVEVVLQRRATSALAALAELTSPKATVRRAGVARVIDAADLVRGDVVELAAGDRAPADIELTEGSPLVVDESILSGESAPVTRHADGDSEEALVRGGTMVHQGSASGVVVATGAATAIGSIARSIQTETTPPLVDELRSIAVALSVGAIALGTVLGLLVARRGDADAGDALLAVVALSVAAIPEGLPTTVIAALALGARAMARRGAIVQNLAAIDALGATSVLCTDKTGTITTGRLRLDGVHPLDGRGDDLWTAIAHCHDAHDGLGDPIDVLVAAAAADRGVPAGVRLNSRPFDGLARSMAVVTLDSDATPVLIVKGAPEGVLTRCDPGPDAVRLAEMAEGLAAAGQRVIAYASRASDDLDAAGLRPLGVVSFSEENRPTAARTVQGFHDAGIRVVMATGDSPITATAVCRRVGLPVRTVYSGLDDHHHGADLRDADLVARVDPLTKLALIDAHRSAGHVVAMIGDGVNDAPALKRADVGVAVSGSGTDVARAAADVVLTDGDLETLLVGIREGRRIYRNLKVATGYLLSGNVSEVLVFVGALIVFPDVAVPLLPLQILWLNLITDGLPAIVLGIDDPPHEPLHSRPRGPGDEILARPAQLRIAGRATVITAIVLASTWLVTDGSAEGSIRTQLLLSLGSAHMLLALIARSERWTFERGWARYKPVLLAISGSAVVHALAFVTPPVRSLLDLEPVPADGWLAAVGGLVVLLVAVDGARALDRLRSNRGARSGPDLGAGQTAAGR